MHIVGIGGLPRSGKDTLAEMFMSSGFFGVSLGDIVRDASRERHADKSDPISVANMTETANHMRDNHGPDVVLNQALERYKKASQEKAYKGLVIFSVRTPVEADFILSQHGQLIWVEADDQVRYDRAVEFSRKGEMKDITLETFVAHEALQWEPRQGIPKDAQMNVAYVKQKATTVFENNINDLKQFQKNAQSLIQSFTEK
jgi:dephospho-CoA kinase